MDETKLKFWRVPLHYYPKSALFAFAETAERAIELIHEELGTEEEAEYETGYPEHWPIEEGVIDPYYDEY